MDTRFFVSMVISKTMEGKLVWEPTAVAHELIAAYGRDYVIRVSGPHDYLDEYRMEAHDPSIGLALEMAGGAVVVWLSTHEATPKPGAERLPELWDMIECGGKSREQAMEDAQRKLEQL